MNCNKNDMRCADKQHFLFEFLMSVLFDGFFQLVAMLIESVEKIFSVLNLSL